MPNSSRRKWLVSAGAMAIAARAQTTQAESTKTDELCNLTLKQASELIRSKKISPIELTEASLARIKIYGPKVNAWITVMREQALSQAKALEKEQMAGRLRSPLHGIPIGLKDTIDTAGVRTTGASAVYEYRFPTEDAEIVRKLKTAGA